MPQPNKAILAGLQQYVANKKGIGDPTTGIPDSAKQIARNKTNIDDTVAMRDNIGALVGGGYTGKGTPQNLRGYVTAILNGMPAQDAQNLLTHIAIQNQTPGVSLLNPTQRLQRFYDIRSSVPATDALIQKVKSLGTGPIAAFSETPDITNQQLAATVAKK